MSVTVVVPTYNGAAFVAAALQSVFIQTYPPAEIVIVDDRSTDGTREVVHDIIKQSPIPIRAKVLPQNSGGPALPINVAIAGVTTKYIAILEQDDLMAPRRLEFHLKALQQCLDCELSFGVVELCGESVPQETRELFSLNPLHPLEVHGVPDGPEIVRIAAREMLSVLLHRNVAVSNSNLFFTRDLWRRVGGFDPSVKTITDWNFLLSASRMTSVAYVNRVCLQYHYSDASLCRKNGWIHELQYLDYMRMRHPGEFGPADWWRQYWSWRARATAAFKRGRVAEAARILWLLIRSRAFLHHLLNRSPLGPQSDQMFEVPNHGG
ncbi:glycosyltransferase family 2 protein [Limnoglobus roseus]|uniref:Glycosyltransferase n=1 Tax=Limnoglobus roseus TaxID=2598579 RepID=A0A5C1ACQ7_9BACT|nr:glycosyltransferase family 2 protein [Limnoglobus roseus]QEL15552.1 glycosyltransferase [Limnoglobus roseus]